jgi:hypothetical protein
MIMFESNIEECKQTGITTFDLKWNLGQGPRTDRGSFVDRRDAERYVLSSKRSYILLMFEKYVSHARIIFETSQKDFYRKESKITALERCDKFKGWLQDKKLEAICKVILALEEDLRKILPSPTNPSYGSSESRIMDMIVFCKRELKDYQQTKNQQSLQ